MPDDISIRIFVDVAAEDDAEREWQKLSKLLGSRVLVQKRTIRRYWKIPEYFELHCVVEPKVREQLDDVYDEIVRNLGRGWSPSPDNVFTRESIWNPSDVATFALPKARWAHVELSRSKGPTAPEA